MTSSNNPKKHWFALKVFYNKVFAIEEVLLKKNIISVPLKWDELNN